MDRSESSGRNITAVALTLVGGYLMKRPTNYRDKEECEHVLDRHRRRTNSKNKQIAVKFYKQAQCIASDAPRHKPNLKK